MRARRCGGLLFALCIAACNDDNPTDPLGDEAIPGVSLSATAGGGNATYLIATVALKNITADTVKLHYPAGCPVRLQFFEVNGAIPVFDERDVPCNVTTIVPLTIPPHVTRDLISGFRDPNTILGDSIPPGRYDVIAVVRITGESPIELSAGSLQLAPIPTAPAAVTSSTWR